MVTTKADEPDGADGTITATLQEGRGFGLPTTAQVSTSVTDVLPIVSISNAPT